MCKGMEKKLILLKYFYPKGNTDLFHSYFGSRWAFTVFMQNIQVISVHRI